MPSVFCVYATPRLFDTVGYKPDPSGPAHPQQSSTVPSVLLSLQLPSCFWWVLGPCVRSVLQGALLESSLPKKPQAPGWCPATCSLLRGLAWHGLFVCNKDNSPF